MACALGLSGAGAASGEGVASVTGFEYASAAFQALQIFKKVE